MYKCMFCGKEHKSIDDYAACVEACHKQVKEEQRKAEEEKLRKEKQERFNRITTKYNELRKDLKEFARDYGYTPISFPGSIADLFDSLFR